MTQQFTTRPEITGTFGVAASTHWIASQSAMAILEKGGNAFDAAVCAGMVLQLVEPHMNGPAGDVPLIIHDAKRNKSKVICGQGPIPKAATIKAYRDLGIEIIPGTGLLAAVVPGAWDAWMLMLRDYGTMSLAEVMEIPIEYAKNGVPLGKSCCSTMKLAEPFILEHWPTTAEVYYKDGVAPEPGDFFKTPKIAETWERLVAEAQAAGPDRTAQIDAARKTWSEGFVADAIYDFNVQSFMDVTQSAHKGFLTKDDLSSWEAHYEAPLTYDYKDFTVLKCGPWSQGPVQLQALALLDGFDLSAMDPTGAEFVHVVTEAMKLAFADRDKFYGDPDFIDVPMDHLLSDDYNRERRKLITDDASLEMRAGTYGNHGGHTDYQAAIERADFASELSGFGGGEPTATGSALPKLHRGDTCHLDVVDRFGNMVSATPSGGWLQSSPTIPELGFCLGTRAQMSWLDGDSASSLHPGKRPRTTLTPSMALKDGKAYMVYGTPGGDQQDQWQLIMLLRIIHHGMNLQEAIDCPSFHIEHFPSSFYPRQAYPGKLVIEGRFAPDVLEDLEKRGHVVEKGEDWSEGRLSAATYSQGILKAGANPRGMQGYAVGR